MVTQFGMGLADLVVQPYKGAKESGALGFAKGVGRGALGTFFKAGAGMTDIYSECVIANSIARHVWLGGLPSPGPLQEHVLNGAYKHKEGHCKRETST